MLFVCLRFPYLPLEVFNKRYHDCEPRVVEEARQVLVASKSAEHLGITTGMAVATARALMDGAVSASMGSVIYPRDHDREQQRLHQLSLLAYRFTPLVSCYQADTVVMDVGSSLRLYKGLSALLHRLAELLETLPHDYCCGIANTAKAAWLLSYCEPLSLERQDASIPNATTVKRQLSALPVTLLVEFPQVAQRLQYCGIKQLGQLLALPYATLAKRFDMAFVHYLQEMTGERVECHTSLVLAPEFCRSVDCSYAVNDWQLLLLPIKKLLMELCDFLNKQQLQCNEIHWHLWSADQQHIDFTVSCQRVFSQWATLLELTEIKLSHMTLDMAVHAVELRCKQFSRVQLSTRSLFEQDQLSQEQFQALIARLTMRFSKSHVYQLQQKDSHIPELAYEQLAATDDCCQQIQQAVSTNRPCWLLTPPQPLQWRQQTLCWRGPLQILQGPERIESNWWQQAVSRDYFVALHHNAQRCWIFRDRLQHDRLQPQWFIQGLFA